MTCISFLTDFGIQDGYHGVMYGVVHGIAPDVQVFELTHMISPQNIAQGGVVLEDHAFYYPPGTVHVAVVDPGVGTDRRAIAARVGEMYFVAPDNGLLTRVFRRAEEEGWEVKIVAAENPEYWLSKTSNTFHGRDIFSPVGAHLASGVPLEKIGPEIDDPVLLEIPEPRREGRKVIGEVIHVDRFGNLGTNIPAKMLEGKEDVKVHIAGRVINGLVRSFGYGKYGSGELIALIDSRSFLTISENDGSGRKIVAEGVGAKVEVDLG